MISASGMLSSGGSSVRGWTSASRSSFGVAKSTPRSRERWIVVGALDHLAADEERRGIDWSRSRSLASDVQSVRVFMEFSESGLLRAAHDMPRT